MECSLFQSEYLLRFLDEFLIIFYFVLNVNRYSYLTSNKRYSSYFSFLVRNELQHFSVSSRKAYLIYTAFAARSTFRHHACILIGNFHTIYFFLILHGIFLAPLHTLCSSINCQRKICVETNYMRANIFQNRNTSKIFDKIVLINKS